MSQPTKGSGVWNPGAPEPKHGEVRPGSFKVECQVSKGMWGTCHQRWCASCKGWKPVAGVTGNLACPDCKATWANPVPAKRKAVCCDACQSHGCGNVGHEMTLEGCDRFESVGTRCNCPLCQPYFPDKDVDSGL